MESLIKEKTLASIPSLRFSEFKGDWKKTLLENISFRGSGHTPSKQKNEYYNGSIKWVSLGDSFRLDNGYIKDTKVQVSQEGIDNSSAVVHPAGTVILSRDAGVGKSAILYSQMAVSQHFITWNTNKNELNNWFLYYNFQILKKEFERIAIGSTIKTIGLPYFKKLKITIPSITEQKKIASFLLCIDNRIELMEKKKFKLEEYKKGVLQQVFDQKIRFKDNEGNEFPKWTDSILNENFQFLKGKGLSKSSIDKEGKYECILYGELFTTYKTVIKNIKSKTNFDYGFESEIGDLLIPTSTTTSAIDLANVTALLRSEVKLGGDILVLRAKKKKEVDSVFFAYYLTNHKKIDLAKRAQGITIIHLYSSSISDMKIEFPSLEEQTKIAAFLTAIDDNIKLVGKQIDSTNKFKKGLLQQMFV